VVVRITEFDYNKGRSTENTDRRVEKSGRQQPYSEDRLMNKRQLERYRKLLTAKREELLQLVKAARTSEQEGGVKDAPDLGDRALSTVIRDLSYQLTVGERQLVRRIDDALDRIESKEFGSCLECGKKVQPGRLDAVPWARHCIECQELQDRGEI
jgi:DnaK suppressor protein